MLEVLVLGVRMSEINPVGNISIIPSKRNINFKAAGIIPADNDYDVFIKKQQNSYTTAERTKKREKETKYHDRSSGWSSFSHNCFCLCNA